MINVSNEFKQILNSGYRNYLCKARIVLTDGTILNVDNEKIMSSGFSVENVVSQDDSFTALGSCIVDSATLSIYNNDDFYSDYVFEDAQITMYVGLELSNTTEYIQKGVYIVNTATYGDSTITLNLMDNMIKFDKAYSESTLIYPATLSAIVRDACSVCGVTLSATSVNFPNSTYTVSQRPNSESTTFREVLSWVATIAGRFLRCDINGNLEFAWFDTASLVTEESDLDGGIFDSSSPYSTGDVADGGTFNPWNTGYVADAGTFTDRINVHYINQLFSQNFAVDDITITGVRIILDTIESSEDETVEKEYLFGNTGYIIEVKNNPFITSETVNSIGTYLSTLLVGLKFRPCTISHINNPLIEAGDVALAFDKKGDEHPILITRVTFAPNSQQTIVCGAESPTKNSSAQLTETTKSFLENAKKIKETKRAVAEAFDTLTTRLNNAGGLYYTVVPQTGGGSITYYHNKPELSNSNIQLVVSDVGITVTSNGTDAHPTWYGLTVDGQYIANIMNTIGINFDWGVGGELQIKKGTQETFYANANTGVVRIVADSFKLSSGETLASILQSATSYTDTSLADYENEVTQSLQDLQDQIDGVVDTYYYAYTPTTNNYPANSWAVADYPSHEGDMFLDTSTGKSYRWVQENNVWQWKEIPDTASALALQTALEAKDIADGKRRIFTSQPTTPYDTGDLWVEGANGDIKVCNTARTSGKFVASDWGLASKYTDNSAFNAFVNGTYANFVTNTSDTLNTKVTVYYSSSLPNNPNTGDLLIRPSQQNRLMRYDGSQWVSVQDGQIADALQAAGDAQATADSKIITYAQSTRPTGTVSQPLDIGDLWIDTAHDNKIYRYSDTQSGTPEWIPYTDMSGVNQLDNSLDQEEVFNRLTNNSNDQGVYLENQRLYINGEYIKAKSITADKFAANTLTIGNISGLQNALNGKQPTGDYATNSRVNSAETNASKTATNYITYVDSTNGIRVFDSATNRDAGNYSQINSNGLEVFVSDDSVAKFGTTARIGKESSYNTIIDTTSMKFRNGTTVLAEFGASSCTLGNATYKSIVNTSGYQLTFTRSGTTTSIIKLVATDLDDPEVYPTAVLTLGETGPTIKGLRYSRTTWKQLTLTANETVVEGKLTSGGDLTVDGNTYCGRIYMYNKYTIYGENTNGDYLSALQACNENNNCVLGYGGYNSSIGSTNVYGNAVNVFSRGNINLSGTVKVSNNTPFVVQSFHKDNIAFDPNDYMSGTISVSKTGYKAIGVVGFWSVNSASGGAGTTLVVASRVYLSGATTVTYNLRNLMPQNVAKIDFYVNVLFAATGLA